VALIVDDSIVETSSTTGTGALTLLGAVTGFKTFGTVMTSPSDTCYYLIEAIDGSGNRTGEWEAGLGTYSASNTLTRTTVHKSSNANAAVSFSAGTKRVMICATAAYLTTEVQDVPIPAASMKARTTNGAAAGSAESATNKILIETFDFDASTDEFVQFYFPMPKSWNEGTVTAKFIWYGPGGTGNVVWGIQAVALSDDDVLDTAFGTAQTVTDGVTATTDVMHSAFTSAITIAGTPAERDLVVFQVYRDADNGSDTLASDAKLLAVVLQFTMNAKDDS
jgi:hypothetical protein